MACTRTRPIVRRCRDGQRQDRVYRRSEHRGHGHRQGRRQGLDRAGAQGKLPIGNSAFRSPATSRDESPDSGSRHHLLPEARCPTPDTRRGGFLDPSDEIGDMRPIGLRSQMPPVGGLAEDAPLGTGKLTRPRFLALEPRVVLEPAVEPSPHDLLIREQRPGAMRSRPVLDPLTKWLATTS